MNKKINLASTDHISKKDLDQLMKEVVISVKEKKLLADKELNKKIDQEIQNAKERNEK